MRTRSFRSTTTSWQLAGGKPNFRAACQVLIVTSVARSLSAQPVFNESYYRGWLAAA
jgi:hypothetical protein